MLVEHGVDHVDKGLIGGEETISAAQQIAFEHALHGVLAQHLNHTPIGRQFATVLVFGEIVGNPEFLGDLVDSL